MTNYKELNKLIERMDKRRGFDWLCDCNGFNIERDDYRTLFGELLYAVETKCTSQDYAEVIEEFKSNLPDWWQEEGKEDKPVKKITYAEMARTFRQHESTYPNKSLVGYIVFSADNWPDEDYSLESRTYCVSSKNKAYMPNMGGYSIYAGNLDGTDRCVRLEGFMKDEGVPDGWTIDYCYMEEEEEEE